MNGEPLHRATQRVHPHDAYLQSTVEFIAIPLRFGCGPQHAAHLYVRLRDDIGTPAHWVKPPACHYQRAAIVGARTR